MTREYKVTIIHDENGVALATRVKDECNFLPIHCGEYININGGYFVVKVLYVVDDIWEQIIYVKEV